MTHRISKATPLLLLTLLLGGCGYSTKTLYNRSVKTIAVPIFANTTYRRSWEFRLTEALCKDIESRTPFKLAEREKADTVLSGEIVDIQETVLTRREGVNLPRETQLTVSVNFIWKDQRTGRILVERKNFSRSATEILQLNERLEDASQLATERLARAIVDQMQADW